ncbi:MAG: tRNA-dihydrouridine synthase family protein [Clostridia bacterium]|nr:tRNA-dihydrouridine synthase family protein [Clostridia bacterium]
MKVQGINYNNLNTENNIFVAPIAGYTDYAFRNLLLDLGIGLSFTELVSAKGIVYKNKGNANLLYSGNDYDKTAVQIFGSEPYFMRKACESEELSPFSVVDINMGCPVPKIYKNGEGSALLKDIMLAESIVKECVKSGKIITIKIRTGMVVGDDIASEYAKMAEQSGASLITIHGRVREQYYSGEPDFNAIEKAKKSVGIPVIANGGIFTVQDADNMIDKTGADGVMLARGAIANPFLVCELLGKEKPYTLKEFMLKHVKLRREIMNDKRASIEFRKFIPYYFKGMTDVKELKLKLLNAEDTDSILEILDKNL